MPTEELKAHVEEIVNILGENAEKIDPEELERELEKFLEYGVPLEQAKQTLLKKFGGNTPLGILPLTRERTLIADLQPNEKNVHIVAQVITINPKQVTIKGENREIYYGILGDESGTIPFTAWKHLDVEKNDVIEVVNAYTKEWQGTVQLNFGDRVKIEKKEKDALPESAYKPKQCKVEDFRSGIGSVDVKAVILEMEKREVEVDGEMKKVYSGVLGDETGKAQFTSWHDFKLKVGETYQITGGYVKTWKGVPQLSFDENATVKKVDKQKITKKDVPVRKLPLHVIEERRGAFDVEIAGTVIEIQSGSGFVMRCPECNRVLSNGECRVHGAVDGQEDLRVKCIVDDGTGSASITLNKELTSEILGKTVDECKQMEGQILIDEIRGALFARHLRLRGNAIGDSFGVTFIPKQVSFVDVNLEEESAKLIQELEELQ